MLKAKTVSKKLTTAEINQVVWKACDTFRGVIDPSQYKDYILTMLFLKYVSSVHDAKRAFYMDKYEGNEQRVQRAMERERFKLPKESNFAYLYKQRNASNIGELIDIALEDLEDANPEKLSGEGAGIFRNVSFNSSNLGDNKEKNVRLKHLLKDFNSLDLRPEHLEGNDVIGDAYEYLIQNFAGDAGKKAGEFYTPSEVSTLVARLSKQGPGVRIYDPTCGSGSLLIKAAKEVGSKDVSLYGQEANGSTWAMAIMNMFLHGFDDATIRWGDTLRNPKHKEGDELMKFDTVVANPPFSLDKWGREEAEADPYNRFWRGMPPKSKGDWAFISHMIESTYAQKGLAIVVVPHGVLFRGSSEGKIRKQVIEENLLDAVIGLPANLFYGTGIPAAILVFSKARQKDRSVLFIDGSQGFEAGKKQNRLGEQDLDKIVATYRAYKAGDYALGVVEDKYSYLASFEEIEENDFNLNIPRYVDTFEEEAPVDMATVQKEIGALEAELKAVEAEMQGYLKQLF